MITVMLAIDRWTDMSIVQGNAGEPIVLRVTGWEHGVRPAVYRGELSMSEANVPSITFERVRTVQTSQEESE